MLVGDVVNTAGELLEARGKGWDKMGTSKGRAVPDSL